MSREPIVWVEIDVDQCTRTYSLGLCNAILGTTGDLKCFNTFKTCQDTDNYNNGSITYKFYMAQSSLPKDEGIFPCLQSVSNSAGVVNIAGSDTNISGIGKRDRISFTCADFPYGDRYTDKYADERKSGAAQSSGVGYDPYERGLFFRKLRARWPYYAGRACRYKEGFIENGVVSDVVTSHYILTDMDVDVAGNTATFEAKDILKLADDNEAVAPRPNNGALIADIASTDTTFTLTPSGIGNLEYEASGRISIDDELMDFTRSGDVMTVVRGVAGTVADDHSAEDSVQQTFSVDGVRIDAVIEELLTNYGHVDASYINSAEWDAEASRWASSLNLTANVIKPTGVNKLLSEIVQLGVSVWWNRQQKKVGFKVNRPPDEDTIFDFNDEANIKSISLDDRDDERLTQIAFYTDLKNPTDSATDPNSYKKLRLIVDSNAQSTNEFDDEKIRQVTMRWLGSGNESLIRIVGKRLLNRFRWSPAWYTFKVTYDPDLELTDVIRVNSRIHQDATGANEDKLMQAISVRYDSPKHEMTVVAQTYQFDEKYARIAPNATPVYTSATDEEKRLYAFIADSATGKMSDGSDPYLFT